MLQRQQQYLFSQHNKCHFKIPHQAQEQQNKPGKWVNHTEPWKKQTQGHFSHLSSGVDNSVKAYVPMYSRECIKKGLFLTTSKTKQETA